MHSLLRIPATLALLVLLPYAVAAEQRPSTLAQAIAAAINRGRPTVTILAAASGASMQGLGTANPALSFGRTSYYAGRAAPGVSQQSSGGSIVMTTQFALKVDCSDPQSALVEIEMTLNSQDASYTVTVDGTPLSTATSATVQRCGSVSEHRVVIEVPRTRPAGPFGSTVSFSAIAR
ncbi:hypothetical protein [Paludibaculum fermentans]|uniref:Uncharacterized protein n=1 Tax=Paludibaculum fermentans TaxID=1473598 RepID=A0A7S7SJL9_PALFE|nr:hypothetical protein [Paludibaculum fermentans]QOY86571.1 hypothetical protein IRI77_27790 [Paludibaculum fermentans]